MIPPESEDQPGDIPSTRSIPLGNIGEKFADPIVTCELCGLECRELHMEVTVKWHVARTFCYPHGLVWVEAAF